MICSMTGFGQGCSEVDGVVYTVEVRSVNNRYFKAQISDSLLETGTPGLYTLSYRIDEGLKASVKRITYVGNDTVKDGDLRKTMKTKKDGLFGGGDLKMDVLTQDFEAIARYYATEGYLDAEVLRHEIDLAENGKDLTLRIHVREGRQYSVGDITWSGNTVHDDRDVQRQIKLRQGEPFSEDEYESSTTALYELYQDKGYFYFNATPRRDVQEDGKINLHYVIYEGAQARLGHVRVVGNTKTQDKVVLREFTLYPGDTFERSRLMRSMRDVFQLGFFDDVVPNVTPRSGEELVDVELRVAERQTGQLGAGAGYSAINGLTGFFEMAETNLFGAGKRLSFRWEFSRRRNDISFSFTQPWFLDTPTSVTTDLFNSSGRTRTNSFYNVKRTGGALRIGRRLQFLDYTTLFWRYRAERVTFSDFDSSISDEDIQRLAQNTTRSSTGFTLRRNSTDSPFFPTRGTTAEYSIDLSGTWLGGNQDYLANAVELAWFQRVGASKWAFMLKSRFGWLQGLQQNVPPNDELFRLGGVFFNGIRGYDEFEIVPVGNAAYVGGQAMSLFVAELRYPFSPRVHGAVFFDAGDTWNSFSQADFSNLRKGAGFGIRVQMPMLGLLGLDYAYGFDRINAFGLDVDSWNLHFRFGNLF